MANADLIADIDGALHDVELMVNSKEASTLLRFRVKNLKRLVQICGSDAAYCRSLLEKIEIIVSRNADRIRNCHPRRIEAAIEFHKDIVSFFREIDEWYCIRLSDSSCTPAGVLDTISIMAEALVDVWSASLDLKGGMLYLDAERFPMLRATIETLGEQLKFMETLISFSTKLSVDAGVELHHLWVSAEYFTIYVAYHLFTLDTYYPNSFSLQDMLEHLYETYTRVLGSLKLQRWDGDFIALKDFVDFLISDLWDLSRFSTCSMFILNPSSLQALDASIQDLQRLYTGLQTLSTGLEKQQQLSSLSIKIKEGFADVVCDAWIFICSLHLELLRSQLNQTRADLGILNLNKLLNAINQVLADVAANESDVPMLDASEISPDAETQEVEVERMPSLAATELDVPLLNALEILSVGKTQKVELERMATVGASSSTTEVAGFNEDVVVGFNDDEKLIVNQLTRGSKKLQIVAIVGMPGLGKTTLATKVYNNLIVSSHFSVRAWCCASQMGDKRNVLLSLLNQIGSNRLSQTSTEEDLAVALWRSLKRRRYLIFLDDMWDSEAWNLLKESFPDDNAESRIILTSRRHDVAPPDLMVDGKPYFLRQLNEGESLKLLQKQCLFGLPTDLGMKVVEKCKGLPLMIVIASGFLKYAGSEGWDELLDHLSSTSVMEQCRNTLELSYMQLPDSLKSCLVYFGTFRENEEVPVRRLLRLWIAEGFIQRDDMNRPEDYFNDLVGRSLIMIAKQRSLGGVKTCRMHSLIRDFCVQKSKDEGLFHLVRGYEELSAFNEPHDLQRLCIQSEAVHFKQSKLFCPSPCSLILNSSESTQSLIGGIERSGMSRGFRIFKRLKVLNLEQVHFGDEFPSEIQHFVQLTFLAILCEAGAIPEWIGNLSSLETFIKLGDRDGVLPRSVWDLKELQYLNLGGGNSYYTFTKMAYARAKPLLKLDRISGVVIPYRELEYLLRKFPNICKLKCRLQYTNEVPLDLVFLNSSSQIQSLNLQYVRDDRSSHIFVQEKSHRYLVQYEQSMLGAQELSLASNLKKLTLGGFSLSPGNLSTIGALPNLEVLKLLRIKFEGRMWLLKERELSKLRILKMVDSDLTSWSSDEDADPVPLENLEKLVLESISHLQEMPRCLDSINSLGIIEVSDCYHRVLDLVEGIEQRREELKGDSGVKIIRNNIRVQI